MQLRKVFATAVFGTALVASLAVIPAQAASAMPATQSLGTGNATTAGDSSERSLAQWEAGGEYDIYGGRGGAMWDWDTRYKIVNFRTVAWDQSCNAEGIYAFARVHDGKGYTDTGRVSDDCSGGHKERSGMHWYNSRGRIEGITAFVCRDKSGNDECVGHYYRNPIP